MALYKTVHLDSLPDAVLRPDLPSSILFLRNDGKSLIPDAVFNRCKALSDHEFVTFDVATGERFYLRHYPRWDYEEDSKWLD